ncbi:SAP domain-containing protein [Micromonospora sp. NPDC007230]|uniref:SAP domain-containing protein n=1 Tax=Micromonospora sp. NPDC007230 TaxID=3364237 RepID=UPI00367D36E3
MAQRISSGRGTTATRTNRQPGNQTPNTPRISESEISRMRVDDLRNQLRRRGVSGISALRKPELVKTLAKTLRAESRGGGAARRPTGPAGRAAATKKAAAKKAPAKRTAAAKAAPAAKVTGARAKKAAPAKRAAAKKAVPAKRAAAKKAPAAKRAAPAKKTAAKKAPAAKRAAPAKKAAASRARGATTAAGAGRPTAVSTGGTAATPVRTGRSSARSVRSSQQITSLQDRPERPGRSLVTANHEVIQRWARDRGAKPATIAGTEREGRPGVLTFNIPGYRESSRIREITWDDWFRTFDLRGLNLIYQEQMRDGRQSNFFRTENPNREDA